MSQVGDHHANSSAILVAHKDSPDLSSPRVAPASDRGDNPSRQRASISLPSLPSPPSGKARWVLAAAGPFLSSLMGALQGRTLIRCAAALDGGVAERQAERGGPDAGGTGRMRGRVGGGGLGWICPAAGTGCGGSVRGGPDGRWAAQEMVPGGEIHARHDGGTG
ncbi:hypothetical protein D1007_18367 [Hordeum vulgare]|nr:hypothetical protein D1007_18367 [Hordeum vulgare]